MYVHIYVSVYVYVYACLAKERLTNYFNVDTFLLDLQHFSFKFSQDKYFEVKDVQCPWRKVLSFSI